MFCCTGTECSVVPVQNVLLYYCSTECSFVQVQSVLLYRYIMFCCTGTECFVVQVQYGLLYRYRMFCCTGTDWTVSLYIPQVSVSNQNSIEVPTVYSERFTYQAMEYGHTRTVHSRKRKYIFKVYFYQTVDYWHFRTTLKK